MFAGSVSAGGVVSTTVTVNVLVDELACASTAVHVTVVAPIAKVDPEAGVQLATPAPSTASLVDGAVYVITAPAALVASAVASACAAMVGAVVSRTMTPKVVGAATLPWASLAEQLTVVVPSAKVVPESGVQLAVPAPSTASLVAGAL